jgi:hypothetical protein
MSLSGSLGLNLLPPLLLHEHSLLLPVGIDQQLLLLLLLLLLLNSFAFAIERVHKRQVGCAGDGARPHRGRVLRTPLFTRFLIHVNL